MKSFFFEARAFHHTKTKELVKHIPPHSAALIMHENIDVTAAESLIQKQVKLVINYKTSMTGTYDRNGVKTLLEANVPVYDIVTMIDHTSVIHQGKIRVKSDELFLWEDNTWKKVAKLYRYNFKRISHLKKIAFLHFPDKFQKFVENSLINAKKELRTFSYGIDPNSLEECKDKNVLIVGRGEKYEKDLAAIHSWVIRNKPFIIAVDGGAEGLIQKGIKPNIILGDMDSITDRTLHCGARLIAHQYMNGNSPGADRVRALGLKVESIAFPGTSEDIALLLPFWAGANKLFIIGSHTSMVDFLEKGRSGMGSSILTRIQAGHKIVDLRGIHHVQLKQERNFSLRLSALPVSALVILTFAYNEKVKLLLEIVWYSLRSGG